MPLKYFIPFIFFALLISCKSNIPVTSPSGKPGKTEMENLNRYLIQKDRERIQNYIERKGLSMKESSTGLWYGLINEGEGSYLRDNMKILMDYECYLLDGTECYSSKKTGPKEIFLGRSDIEPGLNEGLRLLKPGGNGIFILPPFLAYGLPGDGKMIPPRSIIVYKVFILQSE